MNPKLRIIISVLVGVALAALIAFTQNQKPAPANDGLIGSAFGGSFAGLVDADGKTVTDDRFAGKYELVFFGFTYCPSICPTELQKIAAVLKQLGPENAAKIAPVFVSVDPGRDTPKLIKAYTKMFSPAIIGLTGTDESINKVKADWKIYATKAPIGKDGDYTVNHSGFTYFRAPDGRLLGLFDTTDTPAKLVETIKASLTE